MNSNQGGRNCVIPSIAQKVHIRCKGKQKTIFTMLISMHYLILKKTLC